MVHTYFYSYLYCNVLSTSEIGQSCLTSKCSDQVNLILWLESCARYEVHFYKADSDHQNTCKTPHNFSGFTSPLYLDI